MSLFFDWFLFSVGCFMNKKAMIVSEEGITIRLKSEISATGRSSSFPPTFFDKEEANTIAITKFSDTNHHIHREKDKRRRTRTVVVITCSNTTTRLLSHFAVSRRIRNRNSDRFFVCGTSKRRVVF